jgi:hypothetical protein
MKKMATSIAGPGQLLCDVQVMSLAPNTVGFNSVSGQDYVQGSNEVRMTPNSVNSTQPVTGTKWHALYLEVSPGVLNAGQAEPDLQLSFHVDGVDYSSYFYADISVSKNMLPVRNEVEGREYIVLGYSLYKAALSGNFGSNLPLQFTGPKIAQGIDFYFSSTSGFTTGPTGTFASPPTIKLYGDVYDQNMWNAVVARLGAWNGSINISSLRRNLQGLPPYSIVQPAGLDFGNGFTQLPDGPNQGAVKVHRLMKFATPLNPVVGTAAYPLTNLVTGVGGKAGQVGVYNELGFKFNNTQKAVAITEYGHRPGAGCGYIGITKGTNNVYPADTAYGLVDTAGDPHIWYGVETPVTASTGKYFRLPKWGAWLPMEAGMEVIAGEDAAFFVAAQNGATIAANTDFTAIGGVMIEA